MNRFARFHHQRRHHHRRGNQSDDDSHSSSGSESADVECIDISSSSSSSEHLATEESDHSSSSSSSDNESDEEESLPGAWKVRNLTNEDSDISSTSSSIDSDSDEDVDNSKEPFSIKNEELDRTTNMLQLLNKDKLQKVQQFIKSLDSTNMAELSKKVSNYEKSSSPMDLSQQSITPSDVLSLGLNYVGFDYRRQASASEDLNIRRFISFYGAPPQALAPLFKDIREMFQKERPTCRDLLITCNWLKGYDLMHVLEGRWGYCEDYLRPRIKRCQELLIMVFMYPLNLLR